MSERVIYMDNNATTRPAPEVLDAMLPFLKEQWAILQACTPLADASAACRPRKGAGGCAYRCGSFRDCFHKLRTESDNSHSRRSRSHRPACESHYLRVEHPQCWSHAARCALGTR